MCGAIFFSLAFLMILAPAASAQKQAVCGWEDGTSTILGHWGNIAKAENVGWPEPVHRGSQSLKLTESPEGGTPQAFLAFVEYLSDGDVVEACFWGYDETPGRAPSVRIWAHYGASGEEIRHRGNATGNPSYTDGSGWNLLCHEWVFDSFGGTRDALVVEARLYSPEGVESNFYLDDLEVRVSPAAGSLGTPNIRLACRLAPARIESTWGGVKALYR